MESRRALEDQIESLLRGGQAYESLEEILDSFSAEERGQIPQGAEHSAWQILEHMRIAQADILEFSSDGERYRQKNWPDEYWPSISIGDWERSKREFLEDREALIELCRDASRDLFEPFPWGDGQNLVREALLAADHQSYHLGELVELQRWLRK